MEQGQRFKTVGLAMPHTLGRNVVSGEYVAVCFNCGRALRSTWKTDVWRHKGGFIRCPEPRAGWTPGVGLRYGPARRIR